MKVNLMFRNRDFEVLKKPYSGNETLIGDLGLDTLVEAMAGGDKTIAGACATALLAPLFSTDEILYRQMNLADALSNPQTIRSLYEVTSQAVEKKRSSWFWLSSSYLSSTFSSAVQILRIFTEALMSLRKISDSDLPGFKSEGFKNLLILIQNELSDDYFTDVHTLLESIKEGEGTLISSSLGGYAQGVGYVLRRRKQKNFRLKWHFSPSYTLAPRDDSGARDIGKRRDRAINEATNALAQAAEHLDGFFSLLRGELAFYVGCINLAEGLRLTGMPTCIPGVLPGQSDERAWRELYDVGLALIKKGKVVGNDLDASGKRLYIVTGANQGGKSTFLRSIGQAQLMAQCGMIVGAESFSAPVRNGVFTHFKKEEDAAMKSGKLDEELARMNALADHLKKGSLMLFNESFASTNEREGSEISQQITQALVENGVEVFSVTHLYTYAAAFLGDRQTQYLRAQRLQSGERTFKIIPGEPLQTAFGEDLYNRIFAGGEVGYDREA